MSLRILQRIYGKLTGWDLVPLGEALLLVVTCQLVDGTNGLLRAVREDSRRLSSVRWTPGSARRCRKCLASNILAYRQDVSSVDARPASLPSLCSMLLPRTRMTLTMASRACDIVLHRSANLGAYQYDDRILYILFKYIASLNVIRIDALAS